MDFLTQFELRDVVDVLIVAYVLYRGMLLIRGTRAVRMAVGLLLMFVKLFDGSNVSESAVRTRSQPVQQVMASLEPLRRDLLRQDISLHCKIRAAGIAVD